MGFYRREPEPNYCFTRRELRFKNPEGQLARWIERLQSNDFSITHRTSTCQSCNPTWKSHGKIGQDNVGAPFVRIAMDVLPEFNRAK